MQTCDSDSEGEGRRYTARQQALVCGSCGWWYAFEEVFDSSCGTNPDAALHVVRASGAALKRCAEFPSEEPLRVLRSEVQHALKHGRARDSWATTEDATAAILGSFGYDVRGTSRSKDGGVDVIARGASGQDIFVQVKHSRNSVGVRVLRELVGTMFRDGVGIGLLVTTSSFTASAQLEAERFCSRGMMIELVDGDRFLAALNLTARLSLPTLSEILAIGGPSVMIRAEELRL